MPGFKLDDESSATDIGVGALVRVTPEGQAADLDRCFAGIEGALRGFTRPHGYACLRVTSAPDGIWCDNGSVLMVHPENIEQIGIADPFYR